MSSTQKLVVENSETISFALSLLVQNFDVLIVNDQMTSMYCNALIEQVLPRLFVVFPSTAGASTGDERMAAVAYRVHQRKSTLLLTRYSPSVQNYYLPVIRDDYRYHNGTYAHQHFSRHAYFNPNNQNQLQNMEASNSVIIKDVRITCSVLSLWPA